MSIQRVCFAEHKNEILLNDIEQLKIKYGLKYGDVFIYALKLFLQQFQILNHKETKLIGPTIEGVGYYPKINPLDLKIEDEELYYIGDNSGIFRGIIASMLSGVYLSQTIF